MSALGDILVKRILEIPYLTAGFEAMYDMAKKMDPETPKSFNEFLEGMSDDPSGPELAGEMITIFDAVAARARQSL